MPDPTAFAPSDPGSSASGDWLFSDPGDVLKVVALSGAAFLTVAVAFRVAGTRAAGQMNNFDWIVTVAQGAIVGNIALGSGTSLAEGVAAVLTLLAFQYAVNWVAVRWPAFRGAVFSQPVLLYHGGDFLRDAMRKARVNENEVRGAVRSAGTATWDDVGAVVLEPGGEFSVLPKSGGETPDPEVLKGVAGADELDAAAGGGGGSAGGMIGRFALSHPHCRRRVEGPRPCRPPRCCSPPCWLRPRTRPPTAP